ncbi:MAG: rhodanese-related sulfurtransferase [Pseudomonadota bacterium]
MMHIAAFYQFTPLKDPDGLRPAIRTLAEAADVRGTILMAPEGINGTIAGPRAGVDAVLAHVKTLPGCADLEWKEATAEAQPFRRLKVRLKREIVTLGQPVDPNDRVGTYVAPEDWNDVVNDPDTVVIDTRNDYEVAIGTFDGAVDPKTASFSEFPAWWDAHKDAFEGKRVAMFCTGGIRCEKASSWLLGQGVNEVLHLKGGILKYLERVPANASTWDGECYVFDDRVSVVHGLERGSHTMCHACGRPVSPEALKSPHYKRGVSCPACMSEYSDDDRARFADRQRQMDEMRATSSPGD